jgi:hypothetical protein
MKERGYIEAAAHESAVDAAEFLSVQVDLGLPVDAVEVEPDVPAIAQPGTEKLVAIPEVSAEKRVGDEVLIVAEVGIGDCAVVEVAGEDGAGDGGDHPLLVREAGRGDLFTGCRKL